MTPRFVRQFLSTLPATVSLLALTIFSGCSSIKRAASNQVADALAASGTIFSGDDDPELIRQAVPFSLKLMESALDGSPRHQALLLATSSSFTQYAYAFVQQDADEAESTDYTAAEAGRARAKRLYLRARGYGLRGLAITHPDFADALARDPRSALLDTDKDDVPLLYWTAAAWGAAISVGKDDPVLLAQIPQMEALIDRAAALDPHWGHGAIHNLLINIELSRQSTGGDRVARARQQFEYARQLAGDAQAAPFVTCAESINVETRDAAGFSTMLQQALAIDPDKHPEFRLANLIAQRRARWLLNRKDDLFLRSN